MGYTYVCDNCGDGFNHNPPFVGEFTDTFIKTSPSQLAQDFNIGETVTMCERCMEEIIYG